jgi:hypothetical protein
MMDADAIIRSARANIDQAKNTSRMRAQSDPILSPDSRDSGSLRCFGPARSKGEAYLRGSCDWSACQYKTYVLHSMGVIFVVLRHCIQLDQ